MSNTKNTIANEVALYYNNPSLIQKVALDLLEEATEGKFDIVDASNPFMFLLEASASNTHAAMLKSESVSRELYPLLATNYSDLYNHMSDIDYLDRFASPSRTILTLVLSVNSLKLNAVSDPISGTSKVTIPKDTAFVVGGLHWYVHRPIDIVVSPNGAIQVYYDMAAKTPLVSTNNNLLNYNITNNAGREELVIDIPVEQLRLDTLSVPISASNGFNVTINYSDHYYHTRAYHTFGDGVWHELSVTHSKQVYDPTAPTLLAIVTEGSLKLKLPEIYASTGVIGETIRVDLLTTKGAIDIDLGDFSSGDFEGRWQDIGNQQNPYILPLKTMTDMLLFASDKVVGGRNPLSFSELRERVIYRSADSRVSITYEELSFELSDRGYSVTKSKDNLTERKYICSKPLPMLDTDSSTNRVGVRHGKVVVDTDRTDNALSVINHSKRSTITTQALYKETDIGINILSDTEIGTLLDKRVSETELFASELNNNRYYYSPFVYVLDPANSLFSIRTYHLDKPVSNSRSFVANNVALPYAVNTKAIKIRRVDNQFVLTITAEGPKGIADVIGQLVYTEPSGKKYRLNAQSVSISDTYFTLTYVLESTLDITSDNNMEVVNLTDNSGLTGSILMGLESSFDLYYIKVGEDSYPPALFDNDVETAGIVGAIGITHETFDVVFGTELTNLHVRSKGYLIPPTYLTHSDDVYATYTSVVYSRDSEGKLEWSIDPLTNTPVFTILHNVGDPVLDGSGNSVLKYRAGDPVLDAYGAPTVLTEERMVWEIEPVLLDARYRFADTDVLETYRSDVVDSVLDSLEQDIDVISKDMMARTKLVLQPTATIGEVTGIVDGKSTVVVDTSIAFTINYMLVPGAYEDSSIRKELTKSTKTIINSVLTDSTLSLGELISRLKINGGNNVVDVDIGSPLGDYNVVTLIPGNGRFSIKSEIRPLSNGKLTIADALEVTFSKKVTA
jgi:hypothetical protein